MNEDVLKPFPCKEGGCVMSFFTEDHLSVHHQAKHGKLNLEIPNHRSSIFADQTPTPTRLLNNCEELRVFDDLQNINPFEEGFRRAVEEGGESNGFCNILHTPANQDTLHTPQILFKHQDFKTELQDEPENLTMMALDSRTDDSNHIPKNTQTVEDISTESLADVKLTSYKSTPIPLLPKPSVIYAEPILPTTLLFSQTTEGAKSNESVKNKLKNILLSNSGQVDKKRLKTEPIPTIIIGTVPTPTILVNNDRLSVNDTNGNGMKTNEASNVPKKRTRGDKSEGSSLKVERNRAAARRYRTKMKIQSQALQEKYDKSLREIASVKKELSDLKKELTQVKTILLLHKDCPVTKAMPSNSQLDL